MKLLVCTTEYFPHGAGIANVTYNVVEELRKMDVDCSVCSPTGPDIKIGRVKLLQKTGIIGMLVYWYQVSRFFKNIDSYDAIWLHNPFIITRNPFKKCLITIHSTYHGSSKRKVGDRLFNLYQTSVAVIEYYCLKKIFFDNFFTGVSRIVCEELKQIGIHTSRIGYIPNGVNTRKFHRTDNKNAIRERFGIPKYDTVLLSVGRLTKAKQPIKLIEVFSNIEDRAEEISLTIAGNGELYEATKKLAEKMELNKVHLIGQVDYEEDLPDLYACADYFIMTSKYEGLPLTLLEAMASGLPCIVSDIPNLDIVREADCGIVVNFENPKSASDKIIEYILNTNAEHAQSARDYALKNHNWEIIAAQYLKLLKEIS